MPGRGLLALGPDDASLLFKNGPGGGQSLCPSPFSATQVATLDAKRSACLDR